MSDNNIWNIIIIIIISIISIIIISIIIIIIIIIIICYQKEKWLYIDTIIPNRPIIHEDKVCIN